MAQEISGHIREEPAQPGEGQPGADEPVESAFRTRFVPLVALVLVVGMIGLLAYSLFAPEDSRPGGGGRINASGAIITEDGRAAPQFAVDLFGGGRFDLAEQRGKIVVINFWASWCPPCRDETPLLTAAATQLDPDVVLVGIDVWDTREDAQEFLDFYDVNYPVGQDDGSIAIDYGVTGVPETFVIDAEGTIVARLPGPITSIQQLRDMIAAAR